VYSSESSSKRPTTSSSTRLSSATPSLAAPILTRDVSITQATSRRFGRAITSEPALSGDVWDYDFIRPYI
jgi:hypothetical protein